MYRFRTVVPRQRHYPHQVTVSLKYANVERERRFRLSAVPDGASSTSKIMDRYVVGTRMRLREVHHEDGTVTRKLAHKVRLGDGPEEVACTNFYLDDAEWLLLSRLPATVVAKTRHIVHRDGLRVAVDEFEDGTVLAEIDDGDRPAAPVPSWLHIIEDVSRDERWTGVRLAR